MSSLTVLLKVVKRLIMATVFWPFVSDVLISIFSGSMLSNLMKIPSLHFSSDVLTGLLATVASILALATLIAPNHGLYIATVVTTFLVRAPDAVRLSLVVLGLMSLSIIDTYSVSVSHKKNVKVFVEGSKTYYLIIFVAFTVVTILVTHFTILYLNLFTSFMSSIPAASAVRVFGLFLSVNPVGRALLILVVVPVFMRFSLSFIDAMAYFVIPNPTLAKSGLASAVKYDVEIKYPLYTLISFIFTLYMAPPSYYLLKYLVTDVFPWLSQISSSVWSSPYGTFLTTLAEILFFLVLWGFLSYATRFFRGYINNKLVAVFVFLAVFFTAVAYLSSLKDMSEFLSTVYFTYYRDFLLAGELLLQVTGFVP